MVIIAAQPLVASGGQVMAALITGLVLIVIGIANVVVTLWQGYAMRRATRSLADREQWWNRFTWAAEELFSDDESRALVAATVLNALAAVEWKNKDDEDMIFSVFDHLNADEYEQDVEATEDA